MNIYIDIETSALSTEQLAPLLPEFEASKVLKDPAKIEADIQNKKLEWLEQCPLHANRGYVLAAGLLKNGQTKIFEGEEKLIIKNVWDAIAIDWDIIGHFIKGFDIPFLLRRSWILGIKPPEIINGRYLNSRFVDTMEIWACGTRDTISLDNLAKAFGLPGKNGDGKNFAYLYNNPETKSKALEYLENDLQLTKLVADKMGL